MKAMVDGEVTGGGAVGGEVTGSGAVGGGVGVGGVVGGVVTAGEVTGAVATVTDTVLVSQVAAVQPEVPTLVNTAKLGMTSPPVSPVLTIALKVSVTASDTPAAR